MGRKPSRQVGPTDLMPSVVQLNQPSQALDSRASSDLYKIARALFPAPESLPSFILDKESFLKCEKRPETAVAIMRYLAGEEVSDWRGATNVFAWLGLAAENGIGMPQNAELARRYYLRYRMHWQIVPEDRWADGIDDDLIANIQRAGMRPYLEELATIEGAGRNGGAARVILADEVLAADPDAARRWLRTPYVPALNRLIELENAGTVATLHDRADIAFWAQMWRKLPFYRKWAARTIKGAELANGGTIPTSERRVALADVKGAITSSHLEDDLVATRDPIPLRALIDPDGNAIYVEDCKATPVSAGATMRNLFIRLDAVRMYDLDKLPRLDNAPARDKPPYRWVVLPAIHFKRLNDEKIAVKFVELSMEACRYSGMLDKPIAAPSRMKNPATE